MTYTHIRATARSVTTWLFGQKTFPLFLLWICLAAYAPFLPRLGFYWDDYPMNWIASSMGGEGLARYFSTNRPVWGLLYRLTTPILGSQPIYWQIAALLLRWGSGLALWGLLRQIWRGRQALAAWAALLFVIYPGFGQQSIAFVYTHFYIILILFLLSFSATILALRHPRWFWLLSAAALLASAYQLLAMEYFFLLELLRPLVIWLVLDGQNRALPEAHSPAIASASEGGAKTTKTLLIRALFLWLPYLAVFIGVMVWRSLLFGFHTYQPTLMSRLRADPLPALLGLLQTALSDIWMVLYGAWERAFQIGFGMNGERDTPRLILLVVALLACLIYLLLANFEPDASRSTNRKERAWLWQPLVGGLLALLIAGGPFWLTDLEPGLLFPNDRFTLSFMLGASLFTAALLQALPRARWSGAILLAIALTAAVGLHYENSAAYRQDWSRQRAFFWQMVWRAPALQPGTTLLSNDLPFGHYTDNSLSAPLNWIYDPHNDPARMNYILYYPSLRSKTENWLVTQPANQPITRDYLATTFYGNTNQVISLVFNPPGCLRVLDPEIDGINWMVPQHLRDTLPLASLNPILAEPLPGQSAPEMPARLFGTEPMHNWCYYFEKADLARQQGEWEQVTALAELAFRSGDYPNDPAERLPFIEGYAHNENWQRAVELSTETRAITSAMQPALCRLWQRIERETAPSAEQQAALQAIRAANDCTQ